MKKTAGNLWCKCKRPKKCSTIYGHKDGSQPEIEYDVCDRCQYPIKNTRRVKQ